MLSTSCANQQAKPIQTNIPHNLVQPDLIPLISLDAKDVDLAVYAEQLIAIIKKQNADKKAIYEIIK